MRRRRCRWVASTVLTCARCCKEADLASLGWIKYAKKRCTDAAFVLEASTRVAAAAGSGLIDLHLHCVVDLADGSHQPCTHVLGVARKLTLRASGVDQIRREAMHKLCARARRIYAYSSSRKKRPHRFALCIRRRPCRWVSGRLNVLMLGVARKLTLRASGGSVSLSSDAQTQRSC